MTGEESFKEVNSSSAYSKHILTVSGLKQSGLNFVFKKKEIEMSEEFEALSEPQQEQEEVKPKSRVLIALAILVVAALLCIATFLFWPKPAPTPVVPSLATATPTVMPPAATAIGKASVPTATNVTASSATKAPPTQPAGQPVVVTATGMFDIGEFLGDQPMTPVPGAEIDWPHLLKMEEWRADTGLSGNSVMYVQSGVPNQIVIPPLKEQEKFMVPANASLVFGAYYGKLIINGKTYEFSEGFYAVLTEGTVVESSLLKDGFALLIDRSAAQTEYCMRVAQAVNEKWAHSHLYRPDTWTEPVCEGVVTTPLDNDR